MYELRKDPLLGRWVAVNKESRAPSDYDIPVEDYTENSCILCPGHEGRTPPEIIALRDDGSWSVRVFPNFDLVFHIEGELGRKGVGMYDKMNSIGANELIIESPYHDRRPEDIGVTQMTRVIQTYQDRITDLKKDSRIRYVLVFKNSGRSAGAIYTHPHSEIVATPIIPKRIEDELDGAMQYYSYKERCVFCDMMRQEMKTGERVIFETKDFIAFCPFSPKFSFEFWILPKRHHCAFEEIKISELEDLGAMCTTVLKKIRQVLRNPPFNYVIHTAPHRITRQNMWHALGEDYHWHIEIVPRLTGMSGFEWGSGFHILSTSPEDAAKYLREA